ncbi:hypothetical protein [Orrella sp. 11846]|uniref:hypothetical protein n=1 Tax=Orrella sp. 11846 TaxID=3409913 RepID=UPI003B5961BC
MSTEPTSRRSFLFGRTSRQEDTWLLFVAKLKRSCRGEVRLVPRETAPCAYLEPTELNDILLARTLCAQYGVAMGLVGVPESDRDKQRPLLMVQAGRAWGSLMPLEDGIWRVDAGCAVAAMRAAGLWVAPTRTAVGNLAQWIAQLRTPQTAGGLSQFGVVALECLMADGQIEVFSEFGVKDQQPLRTIAAQKAIPALFELSLRPELDDIRQARARSEPIAWPLIYRLDALIASENEGLNLAEIFLGHGGQLVWVIAAHMKVMTPAQTIGVSEVGESNLSSSVYSEIEHQVRQVFDGSDVFLCP